MLSLEPPATESRGIPAAAMDCFYGSAIPSLFAGKNYFYKASIHCLEMESIAWLFSTTKCPALPKASTLLQFIQVLTSC